MIRFFIIFLISLNCWANIPPLTRPVEDLANVLSEEDKKQVESKIRELYDKKYFQMSVLIIDSLPEDEVIENYSIKVAESWKLGSKEEDNGLLLILALKNRKMRLEVGNGIEDVITDLESKRSIDTMKSFLRNENYKEALMENLKYLEDVVYRNTPEQRQILEEKAAYLEEERLKNQEANSKMIREILYYGGVFILFIGGFIFNVQFFSAESISSFVKKIEKKEKTLNEKNSELENLRSKNNNLRLDIDRLSDYTLKETYESKKTEEIKLKENISFLMSKTKDLK